MVSPNQHALCIRIGSFVPFELYSRKLDTTRHHRRYFFPSSHCSVSSSPQPLIPSPAISKGPKGLKLNYDTGYAQCCSGRTKPEQRVPCTPTDWRTPFVDWRIYFVSSPQPPPPFTVAARVTVFWFILSLKKNTHKYKHKQKNANKERARAWKGRKLSVGSNYRVQTRGKTSV